MEEINYEKYDEKDGLEEALQNVPNESSGVTDLRWKHKELLTLFSKDENSLIDYILEINGKESYMNYQDENIYVSDERSYILFKGTDPVLLVAHLDIARNYGGVSVSRDNLTFSVEDKDNETCLGADDKAGVLALLDIARDENFNPSLLFTTDEEIGCLGAKSFVRDYEGTEFYWKAIIELDRRGIDDSVYYQCSNKDWMNYVNSFGFVTEYGTSSDIRTICPAFDVAGVNLSIGYFNEHSTNEWLDLRYTQRTINAVKEIITDIKDKDTFVFYWENKNALNDNYCNGVYDTKAVINE